MSNATAYRTELSVATADYDRTLADIHSDTIHAIIGMVMRLNKKGYRFTISFDENDVSIYCNNEGEYLKLNNRSFFSTVSDLISALELLESMDGLAAQTSETVDDVSLIFIKEDERNAEAV